MILRPVGSTNTATGKCNQIRLNRGDHLRSIETFIYTARDFNKSRISESKVSVGVGAGAATGGGGDL